MVTVVCKDTTENAFAKLDNVFDRAKGNDYSVATWIVADFSTIDTYCFLTISHNEEYGDKSAFILSLCVEDSDGQYLCRLAFNRMKYIDSMIEFAINDCDTLEDIKTHVNSCRVILEEDSKSFHATAVRNLEHGSLFLCRYHYNLQENALQDAKQCEEMLRVLSTFDSLTKNGL